MSTNEIGFFLHQRVREAIESRAPRSVLIYGGRGLGKSTILADWKQRNAKENRSTELLLGRTLREPEKEIAKALGVAATRDLLIDDVDHCFTREVARVLYDHVKAGKGARVILASRVHPDVLQQQPRVDLGSQPKWSAVVEMWTMLIAELKIEPIDPWRTEAWVEAIATHLHAIVGNSMRDTPLSALVDRVRAVTGGHPSLVGPALDECQTLVAAKSDLLEIESLDSKGRLERHLETRLADTALSRLTAAVEGLKRNDAHAYAVLVALARDPDRDEPNTVLRRNLRQEGLVCVDPGSGQLQIPCDLIRELVLAQPDVLASAPLPQAQPSGSARWFEVEAQGDAAGVIRAREALDQPFVVVPLGETMWALARELSQHGERLVSVEVLRQKIGAAHDHTVRSGLQRLSAKLSAAGIHHLIENVHGQGYRFVHPKVRLPSG